jgi:CheY-like chemotaxis protein
MSDTVGMENAMRVLLVEDDRMIGQVVQDALKDASCAADWVEDGQAALDALDRQHYDVVLLDLGLPRKSGHAVLTSLRAWQRRAGADPHGSGRARRPHRRARCWRRRLSGQAIRDG